MFQTAGLLLGRSGRRGVEESADHGRLWSVSGSGVGIDAATIALYEITVSQSDFPADRCPAGLRGDPLHWRQRVACG